jgi:hypothetical protein
MQETIGMRVERSEVATLEAEESVVERIRRVAAGRDRAAIREVHLERTEARAEPTEGLDGPLLVRAFRPGWIQGRDSLGDRISRTLESLAKGLTARHPGAGATESDPHQSGSILLVIIYLIGGIALFAI